MEQTKEYLYCDELKCEVKRSYTINYINSSNRGIIAIHKKDFKCDNLHLCKNFDCNKIKDKDELIYTSNLKQRFYRDFEGYTRCNH